MRIYDTADGKRLYKLNQDFIKILKELDTIKHIPPDLVRDVMRSSEKIDKLTADLISLHQTEHTKQQ